MAQAPIHCRSRGFTLIELMIVVSVIALLAAIAAPMYNEQVRTSRRTEAQSQLNQMAQCMERFNTSNGTYVGGDANCDVPDTQFYTYAIAVANRTAFTATATASGAQTADRCGDLGLNQAGQKTHTTGTGCWN